MKHRNEQEITLDERTSQAVERGGGIFNVVVSQMAVAAETELNYRAHLCLDKDRFRTWCRQSAFVWPETGSKAFEDVVALIVTGLDQYLGKRQIEGVESLFLRRSNNAPRALESLARLTEKEIRTANLEDILSKLKEHSGCEVTFKVEQLEKLIERRRRDDVILSDLAGLMRFRAETIKEIEVGDHVRDQGVMALWRLCDRLIDAREYPLISVIKATPTAFDIQFVRANATTLVVNLLNCINGNLDIVTETFVKEAKRRAKARTIRKNERICKMHSLAFAKGHKNLPKLTIGV